MNYRTLGIAAAAAAVGAAIAVAFITFRPGGTHGITIRPVQGGRPQLEAKWADIQKVLDDYPHLYYIQEYANGSRVGEPTGNTCSLLPLANLEKVDEKARAVSFTGHAVQIGIGLATAVEDSNCLDEATCPDTETTKGPRMPQAHYKQYIKESAELVGNVEKILHP